MPFQAAGREWSQSSHPGNLTPEDKLLPSQTARRSGSPSHLKCGHSSSVGQWGFYPEGTTCSRRSWSHRWKTLQSHQGSLSHTQGSGFLHFRSGDMWLWYFSPPCIPGRALLVSEEAKTQEVMDFFGEDVGRDPPPHFQEKDLSWPHAGTQSIGELAPGSTPLHLQTLSFLCLLLTHYLGPEPLVRQSVMGLGEHPRARCVAELWLWAEREAMEAPLASQHSFLPPELPHGHCPFSPPYLLPV